MCCVAETWITIRCGAVRNAIESNENKNETFYPLTRVQRGHNESDFESTTSSIALFSLRHFSLASVFAGIGIHATHEMAIIILVFVYHLPYDVKRIQIATANPINVKRFVGIRM